MFFNNSLYQHKGAMRGTLFIEHKKNTKTVSGMARTFL